MNIWCAVADSGSGNLLARAVSSTRPRVFHEDVHGRQGRVVARQHVGHAVFEHPAVARAVGDDLVDVLGLHAFAQAQGHGFGGGGDVHAREQLVDDLDLAAVAGPVAQLVDLGGHVVERAAGLGVGGGGAGGHHRHFARCCLGRAAGNGRVQVQQAQAGQARFELHRPVRVHRGAHDEQAAGPQGRRGTALAEQHGFGLRGVHHHAHDHLAVRGQFGRAGTGHTTVGRESLGDFQAHVAHVHVPARAAQRSGHAAPHGAQANHTNVLVCHEKLLRCGHLKPSACGTQVVRDGMKVSSMRIRPCTHRKGLSSRVSALSGTLDTLEVTNSRPPTGGVIMPSVRL